MIRATTPKHQFIFNVDPTEFEKILITYKQGDRIVLEKTELDLTFEENTIGSTPDVEYVAWFRLTQEETNLFTTTGSSTYQVQVRVLTVNGEALASDKKKIVIQDVLNDEVLV